MPDFKAGISINGTLVLPSTHPIQRGAGFPATPSQYDLLHRTDLGVVCEWTGTYWMGTTIETAAFNTWNGGAAPFQTNATAAYLFPIATPLYIIEWRCAIQVNTTNNATNYWSIALSADGTTTLSIQNTAAFSAGQFGVLTWIANAVASPTTHLRISVTKSGTSAAPGPLYIATTLLFRRVYPT